MPPPRCVGKSLPTVRETGRVRVAVRRLLLLSLVVGVAYLVRRALAVTPTGASIAWEPVGAPDPAPDADAGPPAGAAAAPGAAWVEPDGGGCPPSHPVKVKLASGIYHVPGGRSYERTRPDRCYRDRAAAEADGFRAARLSAVRRARLDLVLGAGTLALLVGAAVYLAARVDTSMSGRERATCAALAPVARDLADGANPAELRRAIRHLAREAANAEDDQLHVAVGRARRHQGEPARLEQDLATARAACDRLRTQDRRVPVRNR